MTGRTMGELSEDLASLTPKDLKRRDELPAHLAEFLWWEPVHAAIRESKSKAEKRRKIMDALHAAGLDENTEDMALRGHLAELALVDEVHEAYHRGMSKDMARRRKGKGAPGPLARFINRAIEKHSLAVTDKDGAWLCFLTILQSKDEVTGIFEDLRDDTGEHNINWVELKEKAKPAMIIFDLGDGGTLRGKNRKNGAEEEGLRRAYVKKELSKAWERAQRENNPEDYPAPGK